MRCLGLDIGSSSIKGAVLDLEFGTVHSIVKEPFPDPLPGLPTGWYEIDPLEVASRTRRVIEQLLEIAPDVNSAYFCGQMGGVVLVDAENRPVTNYLSWRDQRTLSPHPCGGDFLQEIQRRIGLLRSFEGDTASAEAPCSFMTQLGNELKPGSATSLLFWLGESAQLPPGARPSTIGDFVIAHLSGNRPRMEQTQAIGLVDLQLNGWNTQVFEHLGLDSLDWGEMATVDQPVAHCSISGHRLALYPTLGDQQCALRGAGLKLGDLSVNVSTGSQVSCVTREFIPGPYQSRYFFGGHYLNTITHLPAGRSLNALVDLLTEMQRPRAECLEPRGEESAIHPTSVCVPIAQPSTINSQPSSPWPYIAHAAANAPDGAGGLRLGLSFFDGPLGREGQLTGITTENLTVGNLFRAAFESMAETYSRLARILWPSGDWQRVVLSGGLTQTVPILRELIERRFPGQVVESTAAEETLLGLLEVARDTHSRPPHQPGGRSSC